MGAGAGTLRGAIGDDIGDGMDLKQLQALVAIAEHGTFSSAAKALHTVQSNISSHVAHLERELGVTLVDRAANRLTDEGAVVVARTRRIQNELDAIRADVASLGADVTGNVRVGVIGTTARWLVPGLLESLRAEYPKVRAIVVEASTTSLMPQLLGGQLDLAVLNLPVDHAELSAESLFDEDLVVVTPADHALAERGEVSLVELSQYPLILSAPGTALRADIDLEAGRAGVQLCPLAELDGVRLMASLAFQGFGPAILPATAVPSWLNGPWRRVAVSGLPRRQVGLVRRRRGLPSTPAHALARVLRTVVRDQGSDHPGLHLTIEPDDA